MECIEILHGKDFTCRFLFQFVWDAKILQLGKGSVKITIIKKDAIAQYWQRYAAGGTLICDWSESGLLEGIWHVY